MLSLVDVSLRRGTELLFEQVNLNVHRGQKFGITGANGSGKSSLLALIVGDLSVDRGDFNLAANCNIARVEQETEINNRIALEYVIDGDRELREIQARLERAEAAQDGSGISSCHERLQEIEGYQASSRAARLLAGLGFAPGDIERPLNQFSGGWIMRLNLARALMCRSDLLLLDEPTNHLDLDAVIWLEQWLRHYPGTLLLISHDREFLDAIVDNIAHVEAQRIESFRGNYSAFEQQKAEKLALQQASYVKQQHSIAHMQRYIDRFRYKAKKARQAQSRIKALEKMTRIAPAHVDSPFRFEFREPHKLPPTLIRLEQASVGYPGAVVLDAIDLTLMPGERIGLLGRNGAGKSTLIRLMAGELDSLGGDMIRAKELQIGYFAQHQVEQLDLDATPLLTLQRLDPSLSEREIRTYLGGFNFRGDKVLQRIKTCSGGEKARLVLALIIWLRPNLLLLDEPTNHLDLEMRLALNQALQGFEGSVVLVSHDRHLLRTVCDDFWLVDDGRVERCDIDLDAYPVWLAQRKNREYSAVAADPSKPPQSRQQIKSWRNRLGKIERLLDELNRVRDRLEQSLGEDRLYRDENRDELNRMLTEQVENTRRIAEAEEEWLALSEALESGQS